MDVFVGCMKFILLLHVVGADSLEVAIHINGSDPIVRRINEELNLRCSVTLKGFKLDWKLPRGSEDIGKRVFIKEKANEVLLKIIDLQEADSGDYVCTATSRDVGSIQKNVSLIVKPKKGCPENHFRCAVLGHCIHQRFVCDGFIDCLDSTDEAASKCGADPCEGKIRCSDGRCLDYHLCCDPYLEPTCPTSHQIPCCTRFIHSKYNQVHPSLDQQRPYDGDLGFLQSTIYTIIGCAVAFVFIVTIMVIAVCRVHVKRSALINHQHQRGVSGSCQSNMPSWDHRRPLDHEVFFGDLNDPFLCNPTTAPPGAANVLVAYNINSGIHFVGRLVKPPSYSEIVQEHVPHDGPPPPYCSTDNLHQSTLQANAVQVSQPTFLPFQHSHIAEPMPTALNRYPQQPAYSSPFRPNIVVNRLSDSE